MNALAITAKRRSSLDTARGVAADADEPVGHHAWHGASIGGAIGGLIGIAAALIAGAGSTVTLPGMISISHDPLALAAVGAAAGLVNGALAGLLVGWGIPRDGDE